MAKDWFIKQGERTFGPLPSAKLKELAQAGRLTASTLVGNSQIGPWVSVAQVKGLVVVAKQPSSSESSPATSPNASLQHQFPADSDDSALYPHRTKQCPFCAETIYSDALKCRFCGEFLDGQRTGVSAVPPAYYAPQPHRLHQPIAASATFSAPSSNGTKRGVILGVLLIVVGTFLLFAASIVSRSTSSLRHNQQTLNRLTGTNKPLAEHNPTHIITGVMGGISIVLGIATICLSLVLGGFSGHATQPSEAGTGLVIAGFILAVLFPIGGGILGIVVLTMGKIGQGLGVLGLSIFMGITYMALFG